MSKDQHLLLVLANLRRMVLTGNVNIANLVSADFGLDEQRVPSELVHGGALRR